MVKFSIICLLFLAASSSAERAKVSPVQKVIELLDGLKAKVQSDVDAEGAAAEEYASYCDNEIREKGYAIQTATRQIGDFTATIEDCEATIEAKASEVAETGTAISQKEKEMAAAQEVRKGENAAFKSAESELVESVDELAGGIVQVKKGGAALLQMKKKMPKVLEQYKNLIDAASIEGAHKKQLNAFLQSKEDDELTLHQPAQGSVDVGGGGHSGSIIETLEQMKSKAENQLSNLRKAEMENAHNYDMTKMSLEQEIGNLKDQLAAATALRASTGEDLGRAKGDLVEVQKSKASDEEYVSTIKMECEEKAAEWTQRQAEAQEEMGAIAKAKEILANGVKAFVQISSTVRVVDEDDMQSRRRDRLVSSLKDMGRRFHSFAFMQLSNMAKADPFAKIKSLISDMIEKLLKEANEEAEHKAFCDKEIAATTKSREDKSMKLDKYAARIDSASTSIEELEQAIKGLEAEIAEVDAAVAEASTIRNKEHEEYLKASKDFGDSAQAVSSAMQVLKDYYEGGSFMQVNSKTTLLSKSKTKNVGGTIIGVLEVAESDFTRLLAEAETDEESGASAFAKLSQESKVTKATKEAEIKAKGTEIKSITVNLQNYKDDKQAVGGELDAVLSYQDKLKPQCETKVMSYEEKVARREAEIDGLKEALSILEGQDIPVLAQTAATLRRVRRA